MRKKTAYIYGAGGCGSEIYDRIKNDYDIKGYFDSDSEKWGTKLNDIPIIGGADSVLDLMFDEIIIASHPGMNSIREALLKVGVSSKKINTVYISTLKEARVNFLQNFAGLYKNYASGVNVAEGGLSG